jgi:Zn-dependent peptidase ImmA (M78 family)/DNA-binding XRE family transcriptional regulator
MMANATVNPRRLAIARKRRGYTKERLATESGISTRSLTAYEQGDQQPNPLTVLKLAEILQFPPEFIQRGDDLDELSPDEPSFRALSRLTARQRDQAFTDAALALALYEWIDDRFALPEVDVPRFQGIDPETAADAIRSQWGLGEKPIRNMIHLLERYGVRVFSVAEGYANVDAFSFWHDDQPFVFLNTKKTGEHRRMDAAHELGHLILHWRHGAPRGRDYEKEAELFASALLMPRGSVLAEAPRGGTLDQIIGAKQRWKVSAKALAYRMHSLGLLTEWQYRSVFVELANRGYSKGEPKGIIPETSQILGKVFSALRAEGMNRADIAAALGVNPYDLDDLIFGLAMTAIDGGQESDIQNEPANKPSLRLVDPI